VSCSAANTETTVERIVILPTSGGKISRLPRRFESFEQAQAVAPSGGPEGENPGADHLREPQELSGQRRAL